MVPDDVEWIDLNGGIDTPPGEEQAGPAPRRLWLFVAIGAALLAVAVQVAVLATVADLRGDVRDLSDRLDAAERTTTGLSERVDTVEPVVRDLDEAVRSVAVPDVVGLRLHDAEQVLAAVGLDAGVADGDATGPGSVVIAQEPGPGRVPPGAVVGLRTRP